MNTRFSHIEANSDIITLITDRFIENGQIRWGKAFAEHPEWKDKLVQGSKGMSLLHQYANHLRRIGKLVGPNKPVREVKNRRKPIPNQVVSPPTQVVEGCAHCPSCGYHIEYHNRVFAATKQKMDSVSQIK